ncbi:hypothetical protein F444_07532 [Phytophthora nicotianae P1976]|uniref:Uncharacterized protein n=1 Tax=Phytophthora nicotianae P1976 TaxID=1317066 RepID=A0A081AEC4_PHYNI|nr:hypothetical protein F444_07532 [Phytophthora nicotianae P1976]
MVVLAEARKSELATQNCIQEVIYEPREDEDTTKLEAAENAFKTTFRVLVVILQRYLEVKRALGKPTTPGTTEASLLHWEKSVALHGTRKTRSGKETAQTMAWTIPHDASSGVHPRRPYSGVDELRALALQPVVTDERSYCINILHMDLVNYLNLITLWDMD